MSLTVAILLVAAGFVLLAGGGEVLVRGAVAASRLLRVSTAVIGLTVVAMATSLPELAVSLAAAVRGSPDVAVGNVLGSNMFNMAAILGVSALLFPPLRFRGSMIRFDVTIMTIAAILGVLSMQGDANRAVVRWEGLVFLALLAAFLVYRVRGARATDVPHGDGGDNEIEAELHDARVNKLPLAGALILIGAGMLTYGADVLVRGAVRIAELAGVSERVIALTLVSAGTGLPELATAIMAGIRRHSAVAVGNVIGSNIFNVFGILGTVAVVHPPVRVAREMASRDAIWMLGFCAVALFPAIRRSRRISRLEGTLVLVAYVVYVKSLL